MIPFIAGIFQTRDETEGLMTNDSTRNDLCLLVDDHLSYGLFLENVLHEVFPRLDVHVTRNFADTIAWLKQNHTEAHRLLYALVDIGLPDGSGLELIREIHSLNPDTRIIVSTVFLDDRFLFDALTLGAFGYLLKSESPEVFRDTLKRLAQDEPPLSPRIARRLLTHFHKPRHEPTNEPSLTPRERQTLSLLVQGFTVPEAALSMGISPQTVSGYVKVIYQKLHVSNRVEVTREALRRGMV